MCKGINKYTIEGLVNKGVYKNSINNFNDPFDPYLKRYDTFLKDEFKKIKITCFSEEYDNLLLWAHYGDNHKGVCLGYIIDDINENTCFEEIIYKEIKIKEKNILKKFEDILKESKELELEEEELSLGEIYLRKHKKWEYESESRLIHLDIESEEKYYTNLKLREIIFGLEANQDDINLIKNIVKNAYNMTNIKFYKMEPGEDLSIRKKIVEKEDVGKNNTAISE